MRIEPYKRNPFYWQYKGQPVLLLGGSVEDNLFQILDVEEHLDLLASVGGNYVRCTLSSRDEGNVWPFGRDEDSGLYDLSVLGEEYWSRFEHFLKLTSERDIIVQIEVWDRFDYARAPWQSNPFNPKNNINFTSVESTLPEVINTHPGQKESPFFRSVPNLENNMLVLGFQRKHVDQLLNLSLVYNNILYCMDNETNESPEWGAYWADYIRRKAAEAGVSVQTSEMWDAWDLHDEQHLATLNHPERYTFVDLSQNNHTVGFTHWENPQYIRDLIQKSGHIRPINSVKIYGANTGHYGTTRDAQERFWRNIFNGYASSRFHRPTSGLGLSEIAQAHIKAMRMLTDELDIFRCLPNTQIVFWRSKNEAFCTANPGIEYAVFFPDGGHVLLDVSAACGKSLQVKWLDIRNCTWISSNPATIESTDEGQFARLISPREEGYWTAYVKVCDSSTSNHHH